MPLCCSLTRFWAAHATEDTVALLQASPPVCQSPSAITYATLFDWLQNLRETLQPHYNNANATDESSDKWLVLGVNTAPYSIEETALLLLVAEQNHWVYVPVDVQLPLARQLSLLRSARVHRLVTLPDSPLSRFFNANGANTEEVNGRLETTKTNELQSWTVDLSSSPFQPVRVFSFPTNYFQSGSNGSLYECTRRKLNGEDVEAPLYVLFTSGTTCSPRGVLGTRAGAWARLEWMWAAYPFAKPLPGTEETEERVLRTTKLSFVDSVWEVLGAFLQCVPLVHLQQPRTWSFENNSCHKYTRSVLLDDSAQCLEVVCRERVTRFTVIPSVLEVLLLQTDAADRQVAFSGLRYILSSGEVLRLRVVQQLISEFPGVVILNLYGSTEVSGDVTCMELKAPMPTVHVALWEQYGLPIADLGRHGVIGGDTSLMLLLDDVEKAAPAVIWLRRNYVSTTSVNSAKQPDKGLLYVSGSLVTVGYSGNDDTKGTFVDFNIMLGEKEDSSRKISKPLGNQRQWFCTGDICTVIGGYLYFCGRKDNVVKVNGQRVNLEAVECAVMTALKEIENSGNVDGNNTSQSMRSQQVVAFTTTTEVTKYALQQHCIVACLIRNDPGGFRVAQYSQTQVLNAWIAKHCGPSHVPREILVVSTNELRRLAHGKIDRRALEDLYKQHVGRMCDGASWRTTESFENNPKSPSEKILAQVLVNILDVSLSFAASDGIQARTFVELGGNSLLATLFVHELCQTLGASSLTAQELLGMTIGDLILTLNSQPQKRFREALSPSSTLKRQKKACCTYPRSIESSNDDGRQPGTLAFVSRYNLSSMALAGIYLPTCYASPLPPLAQNIESSPDCLSWELQRAWHVDLGKCIDASPLVIQRSGADGVVASTWAIIGSHSAQLVCVDVEEGGQEIWRATLDDRIEACAALSVEQEVIYVGTYAGTLFALELLTGNTRWVFHAKGTIKATALVIDMHQLVVCGAYNNKLYGLDVSTGEMRWAIDLRGSIFSTPYYCGRSGQLFAASTNGNVVALKLSSTAGKDFTNVEEQWRLQLPAPVFAGLNVDREYSMLIVGCADGHLYGVAMALGEVQWRVSTEKPIFSSPCVYRPGSVVFGSHDGMLRKVCCRSGEIVWAANLQGAVFASPTVATMLNPVRVHGRLYDEQKLGTRKRHLMCCVASTTGQIYFCDEETGSIIYRTGALGPLFGSPVIFGNWCLLGTRTNYFYGFRMTSCVANKAEEAAQVVN